VLAKPTVPTAWPAGYNGLLLFAHAPIMKTDQNNPVIYRKDYRPPNHWVKSCQLGFVIEPQHTTVRSTLRFEKNPQTDSHTLELNGVDLELISIKLDGRELGPDDYRQDDEKLLIENVPEQFALQVENRIYPEKNTALEGLYQSGSFFLTQCEAEGFRKITYYPDRPDVMAPFDVTIVADKKKYPVLLSNGNPAGAGDLAEGRHFARWTDPHPKPSYLFALVAGDLKHIEDSYTTINGDEVTLRIYVEEENLDSCDYAMGALKRSMQWDEDKFGLAYDLDVFNIVATNDFNMGAMENKGLNIFNAKFVLARPDTATDMDFQGVEAVIGHEYFHNWTGNRVTCRDWFQLSLKEGLTVFRDQEFTADMQSRAVKRIEDVRALRTLQFAEDAGPMSHPVRPDSYIEINNFYTLTVYEKGAEVVRMYHTLLGADGFRKGMDLYFQRHDGQAVTCDDFRAAMADANHVNLDQFGLWYSQNGTPRVSVQEHWNPETGELTLFFEQHRPDSFKGDNWQPMHIPVKLALLDASGNPIPLFEDGRDEMVYELKEAQQKLTFGNLPEKPVASVLRDFSAPVILDYPRSPEEQAFIMAHDSDAFNRWDAAQSMAMDVIQNAYAAIGRGQEPQCPSYLTDAFAQVLADTSADPALVAETLRLPDIKSMITLMREVNVTRLHQAREFIKKSVAEKLRQLFEDAYETNRTEGEYRVDPRDIAKRSLKNTALGYLMSLEDEEAYARCATQIEKANCMTDKLAALTLYAHHQGPAYQQKLEAFYRQWQHDPLVVNKWLTIQATSPEDGTLELLEKLLHHEAFSMRNPNNVRALVGAFASANPVQFHRADGQGYQWLADLVLELNALNPQVAARIVSQFNSWQQFDPQRQEEILKQLRRIKEAGNLSPDVYEIVSKAIEQAKKSNASAA